ncbi:hypothetical protein ACFIOZ_03970 [Vreelandella sp. F11]|uniref:hypothetical protein n=1 Tax=Vreelandella sp. F11 TaxID=3394751 RepID=UPI0036DBFEFF
MPTPTINFQSIRSHHGSQHGGFEEVVCQLAALDSPKELSFHRKGAGADAGLECYRVEHDGSETGWQAKYFFELGSGEAGQLKESFDNAVAKHPMLARFIVCLPFDLSDGRVGGRKSERDRWDDWVTARQASIAPRVVDIVLWGSFELTERLSRNDPLHVGRRTYWFDLPHFGAEWFRDRFEITRMGLGRRYTPELNVELSIRQALAAFARDPEFVRRIAGWADNLDEARHRSLRYIGAALEATNNIDVAMLTEQVAAISSAFRTAPLGPTDPLPFDEWRALVTAATTTLDCCWAAIWKLRSQSDDNSEIVRNGLYFAEHLREALDRVAASLDAPWTSLANTRRLLLSGEAGVGKSHLLADVAEHHIARSFPAVLTLGGAFSDADPWRQIAEQFGLTNTPPDTILGALDAAAEATGTRALVMVDAINERNGIAVWAERLATFLAVADRFSHVVILVSCRTTFLPYIVQDIDDNTLPRIKHPGFAGKAAEAARRYLDQRGIVRMAAPHFAPEFENPLFLRSCCDMLERRGERELPRGLDGVSSVFNFYFGAIVETLNQRMRLVPRRKFVEKGLRALTEAMVAEGIGYLSIDKATQILDEVHPSDGRTDQDLFFQLENEGVIAVELVREGDATIEMVRFTFERMSDHLIAQRLLDIHVGDGDPVPAFVTGGPLAAYVAGRDSYQFAGIAEALAVQLPERYGIEIIDVVDNKSDCWNLVHAFQLSLLWRRQDFFSERTLELVEEWADVIGGDAVLETLLLIATEPNNRFNADYLDRWLRPLSMPERDVQWSTRVMLLIEESEAGEEAINTLIEWVLANGLGQIQSARARLAAITLTWLTSLSHRWIRDMATKSLATLLVDRCDLAAILIRQFADVDDAYILDRLLAAAYGAATRCTSDEGIAELSQAAFTAVFARTPLSTHALVRDHARGIVEFAASRGVLLPDVPLDRARPPYSRGKPLETISEEALSDYVQDYGAGSFRDQIYSSAVEDGDFARYEIDSLVDKFLRLPREERGRSISEIYDEWCKKAIVPHPERQAALAQLVSVAEHVSSITHGFDIWGHAGADDFNKAYRAAEQQRMEATESLEKLLEEEEIQEFRIRAASYINDRMWDEHAAVTHPTYSGEQSRRWVAWRAHELGWISERFAEFDRHMASSDRMEHRTERIGKKYQWIAYHELAGRLADIALVEGDFKGEPELYDGPWQIGIREMDPTILVTRTKQHDSDHQGSTWWSPYSPNWREDSPEARIAWMEDQLRDIPNPIQQIDVADSDGRRWLVLNTTVGRNQWRMVNGERVIHRMTWHKVKSMLVARNDVERLEKHLAGSPRDRDNPPEIEMPWGSYLGEYPWHPAFESIDGVWNLGIGSKLHTQATVANWFVERAGHNYSVEESFNLTIPAPALMRGLHLRLADGRSLAYSTSNGKVLFKDPSANEPGFSAAVVDRDAFRAFLDAEGLEIVWIVTGEKSAHGGPPHGRGWGGMLNYWGIYRFNGDSIRGELNYKRQDARPEQLRELLAYP